MLNVGVSRVSPLDVTLCVDITIAAILGVVLVFGPNSARLAPFVGGVLGLGFLWLRSRVDRPEPPDPSDNPLRRLAGVLLIGIGGTLTALGALAAAMVVYAVSSDVKVQGEDLVWFAIPIGLLLLGNLGMFLGATVRAPTSGDSV